MVQSVVRRGNTCMSWSCSHRSRRLRTSSVHMSGPVMPCRWPCPAALFDAELTARLVCSARCCVLDHGRSLRENALTTLPVGIFEGLALEDL